MHSHILYGSCNSPVIDCVSCHVSRSRPVVVVVVVVVAAAVVVVFDVASYCIVILCTVVAIPLLTIVSGVTYQGTALLL